MGLSNWSPCGRSDRAVGFRGIVGRFQRVSTALGLVLGASVAAAQNTVKVEAVVRPPGGGTGALQHIGTITVTTAGGKIEGKFVFEPEFRYLDKWYDFRWINVVTESTMPAGMWDVDGDGCCDLTHAGGVMDVDGDGIHDQPFPQVGADACPMDACTQVLISRDLPAIDPHPLQLPGEDTQPFYWTDAEFAGMHEECNSSTFSDARTVATWQFKTFLTIFPVTAEGLPANTVWVLDGFEWTSTAGAEVFGGALAPDVALIDGALAEGGPAGGAPEPNSNGEFKAWTAAPRDQCPLQACPTPLIVQCFAAGVDPQRPDCCFFEWAVTNNGDEEITEFYLDLEAGAGAQVCNGIGDISLPGWTADFCYRWDGAAPSSWAVVRFSGGSLPPQSSTLLGLLRIDVNPPPDLPVDIPGWHPFTVLANGIHCHVTDYTPFCLGVDCGSGEFGPHLASDIHGRDQAAFWSAGGDWVWEPERTCGGTLQDNGVPDGINGYSNATIGAFGSRRTLLDDFTVPSATAWDACCLQWSHVWSSAPVGSGTGLELGFFNDAGGTPDLGSPYSSASVSSYAEVATGNVYFSRPEALSTATFGPIAFGAGTYWLEATIVGPENNFWLTSGGGTVQGSECWVNYGDLGGLQPGSTIFGVTSDVNFRLGDCDGDTTTIYCDETQNPNNAADIAVSGNVLSEGPITVSLSSAPPNQFGYLLIGGASGIVTTPPGAKGDLCVVGGFLGRYDKDVVVVDGAGSGSTDIENSVSGGPSYGIPNGGGNIQPGDTWYFQYWHRQPMGQPATFSSAASVTFQ